MRWGFLSTFWSIGALPFVSSSFPWDERLARMKVRRVGKGAERRAHRCFDGTPHSGGGHASLCPPYCPGSMAPDHPIHGAQLSRLDQLGMRHRDREQRPLELLLPELQKVLQRGKF